MDIYEIVCRWHASYNITQISAVTGLSRKTVRDHLNRAIELAGLSKEHPLPQRAELLEKLAPLVPEKCYSRPAHEDFLSHKDEIIHLITAKVDPVKPKTAYEIICERYDVSASYSSFKRFIKAVPELKRSEQTSTCVFEIAPGQEFQLDYAKMGRIYDPLSSRNRDLYAFIAIASHSRLKFVEFTYKQDQRSFVASNIKMFEFFDGVPQRLVIDNLKSGFTKPDLYDPKLNRAFAEVAEHYGTFIDPARSGRPKDKPRVERAVQIVREQFRKLKALHPGLDISQANRFMRKWSREINGMREHATTGLKPMEAFDIFEKPELKPLPAEHFEIPTWKSAHVHVDQFIQFDKQFYNV